MKAADVDRFEKARAHIKQLHNEMSVLSKSKPDNAVNKFKLGFINEKLGGANELLTGDFKPFKDFDLFEVDQMPSNSDVVMVLSQYLDGLEAWRSSRTHYVSSIGHLWKTDDGTRIHTEQPTRFRTAQ
jgi:hypothetical protein